MQKVIVIIFSLFFVAQLFGANFYLSMKAGRLAYSKGNYQEALGHYEKTALLSGKTPVPHLWRAQCLLRLGQHKASATICLKALSIDPSSKAARRMMGQLKISSRELPKSGQALVPMEEAILKEWLRKGGFVSPSERVFGRAPIHVAALKGDIDMAKYLLRSGAHLEARDRESEATPILWAIITNKIEFIQFLLEQGADIDSRNCSGESALHYAASNNNVKIGQLLLDNGLPIDARDRDGKTSLHVAAIHGHIEFIEFLLRNGAYVKAASVLGELPKDKALKRGHKKAASLLQ